ncbi:MAG: hypothetical protein HY308_05110 [Gammaproteobacteria bacterium]|nr:hypothetical protein [Gammaproteobacteria bacterium]
MAASLVCWKCGASLQVLPQPLSRLAECPVCKAELHVCRLCQFYDARTTRQCSEIRAEEIVNKERANFCDWFKARPNAFDVRAQAKAQTAKSTLDALFGATPPTDADADPARAAVERLFGDKKAEKKQ